MFKVYFWQAEKFTIFLLPGGTNSKHYKCLVLFFIIIIAGIFLIMSIALLQLVVPAPLYPPRVPTGPGPSSLLRSEAHDSSYNSTLLSDYTFLISPAHWPQSYPNPPGPQTTNKKHPGYYYSLCAILTRLKFWLLAFLLLY